MKFRNTYLRIGASILTASLLATASFGCNLLKPPATEPAPQQPPEACPNLKPAPSSYVVSAHPCLNLDALFRDVEEAYQRQTFVPSRSDLVDVLGVDGMIEPNRKAAIESAERALRQGNPITSWMMARQNGCDSVDYMTRYSITSFSPTTLVLEDRLSNIPRIELSLVGSNRLDIRTTNVLENSGQRFSATAVQTLVWGDKLPLVSPASDHLKNLRRSVGRPGAESRDVAIQDLSQRICESLPPETFRVGNNLTPKLEILRGYTTVAGSTNGAMNFDRALLSIVEKNGTDYSVIGSMISPFRYNFATGELSVPTQNLCRTPHQLRLRQAALDKLSRMTDTQLRDADLPMCFETMDGSGNGVVVFRGFLPNRYDTRYVSALMSAVQFDRTTGEIIEISDSASGI